MIRKFVRNWISAILLYGGFITHAPLIFRDGQEYLVTRDSYADFYEQLYRRINQSNGFSYDGDIVTCPNGIGMKIPDWQPFSHVLDEIFTMKWYGSTNLKGLTVTTSDRLLQTLSLYFESLGAEVYAYEPDEQRSALAEENISLNGKEKAIHLFKQLANALMASRLIEDKYLTNVFLKIDCEGCEFEIIGNLPEATLKRVNQVVLEYHANPKTFQRLEKADFRVSIDVGILWAHKTT